MLGHQFAYSAAPVRKVKEVQFGILSPEEIVRGMASRAVFFADYLYRKPTLWRKLSFPRSMTKALTVSKRVASTTLAWAPSTVTSSVRLAARACRNVLGILVILSLRGRCFILVRIPHSCHFFICGGWGGVGRVDGDWEGGGEGAEDMAGWAKRQVGNG